MPKTYSTHNRRKQSKGITEFLKTKLPPHKLEAALEVIREFKKCESQEEWLQIWFAAWAKLEQLEEFLDHLVNKAPLQKDTLEYIKRLEGK